MINGEYDAVTNLACARVALVFTVKWDLQSVQLSFRYAIFTPHFKFIIFSSMQYSYGVHIM